MKMPFPATVHIYAREGKVTYVKAVRYGAVSLRRPEDGGNGFILGGVKEARGNQWRFSSPLKQAHQLLTLRTFSWQCSVWSPSSALRLLWT